MRRSLGWAAVGLCVALLTGAATKVVGTTGDDKLFGTNGPDILDGREGNDTLEGSDGDDTLIGGAGRDILVGGLGSDTYLFRPRDGQDQILSPDPGKSRKDTVRFSKGIAPEDVSLSRMVGDHLVIQYGRGDRIVVQRHFADDAAGMFRIDAIRFANGKTWGADYIKKAVLVPTAAGQLLVGYIGADKISGAGGADQIYGRMGNDRLDGGPGNDRLYGDEGDDVLVGGPGNDLLRGELGSDTYLYRAGDGLDTIQNYSRAGDVDVVRFVDLPKGAVTVSTKGNDLLLLVGSSGKQAGLRVAGFNASNAYPITRVEFAKGAPLTAQELLALFPVKAAVARGRNGAASRGHPLRMERPKAPPAAPRPVVKRQVVTPLDRYLAPQPAPAVAPAPAPVAVQD